MLDVLEEAPTATGWLQSKIPVLLGAPADVTLDIRTMRKDIMSAVATGALSGVPMPLSRRHIGVVLGGGRGRRRAMAICADLAKFVREKMLQNFA